MNWDALTVDELRYDHLVALRTEAVGAVRVPRYCAPDLADRLADALVRHPSRTNYEARWAHGGDGRVQHAEAFTRTDVDRVGPTDTRPDGAPDSDDALDAIRGLRAMAAPDLAPIDRLRLELDEIVPGGARLQRAGDRPQLAGVGRVMDRSDEVVHADVGRRDCLTANVYLRLPPVGGGTVIWRFTGRYREAGQSYRFRAGEIPPDAPSVHIAPEPGDLVIWSPSLPHVVRRFDGGPRVTLQTWVLLRSDPGDDTVSARLLN